MTLNELIMMPTDDELSELITKCQEEQELMFLFNKFDMVDKRDKIEFKGVTEVCVTEACVTEACITKACITEAKDVTKARITKTRVTKAQFFVKTEAEFNCQKQDVMDLDKQIKKRTEA